MIAQFGNKVVIMDGWDVRILKFHDRDAARAWTYGAGIVRVAKARMKKELGPAKLAAYGLE